MQSLMKCLVISSTALLLLASGLYISIYLRTLYPPGGGHEIDFGLQFSPPPPLTTFGRIRNFTITTTPMGVTSVFGRTHSSIAAAFLTPVLANSPTSASGQASTDVEICYNDKGNMVKHGEQYIPLGIDTCTQCTCMHGKAEMCISVLCSPPDKCRKYHEVTNKCCEFLCLDGEMSNGLRFFNKTIFGKSGHDPKGFNPMASNNLGLRLIASTITSFIILAMLLFLIHRLRQRRLLLMLRRLNTRRMVDRAPGDHRARTLDQNALRFGYFGRPGARGGEPGQPPPFNPFGYIEPPPPYSFWKPPEQFIGHGEAPPTYEETVNHFQQQPQPPPPQQQQLGAGHSLAQPPQQPQPYYLSGSDFASQPEALPGRLITLQSIMMNSIGLNHTEPTFFGPGAQHNFFGPSSSTTSTPSASSAQQQQQQQTCLKSLPAGNFQRSVSLNHGKYLNRHASLPQVLPNSHHRHQQQQQQQQHMAAAGNSGNNTYQPQHMITHLVNGDTPQSYISPRPLSAGGGGGVGSGRAPPIIDTVISNPSYEHITVLRIGANNNNNNNDGNNRNSYSGTATPTAGCFEGGPRRGSMFGGEMMSTTPANTSDRMFSSNSLPFPGQASCSTSTPGGASHRLLGIGLHNKAMMPAGAPLQVEVRQHRTSFGGGSGGAAPARHPSSSMSVDKLANTTTTTTNNNNSVDEPPACSSSISMPSAVSSSSISSSASSTSSQSTVVQRAERTSPKEDKSVVVAAPEDPVNGSSSTTLPIGQPKASGVTFATISRL